MAPTSSKKQKRVVHGSPKTRKGSSIADACNASGYQNPAEKDDKTSSQQIFLTVPRKWLTWPDLDSLAQKASNVATTTNGNWNSQLSPMERWRMEATHESPWNDIAMVDTRSERWLSDFGEKPKDGSQGDDTDNGTWWP